MIRASQGFFAAIQSFQGYDFSIRNSEKTIHLNSDFFIIWRGENQAILKRVREFSLWKFGQDGRQTGGTNFRFARTRAVLAKKL